jgi:hypothetical protein
MLWFLAENARLHTKTLLPSLSPKRNNMALPKSATLEAAESAGTARKIGPDTSLEKSHNVVDSVPDQTTLPAVEVFNDYVAVMLTPRESQIALPGASGFSNVGVIVGVGTQCVNSFKLGQNVIINPKGGGIVNVEEQGPAYEGRLVQLFTEKNIFYKATTGPKVNVVCKPSCEPDCGSCDS